jgi:hypothetical protein
VLIGGLAAVAHGSAIPTTDLDLVPDASQDNLGRLAGALSDLEAKLRVPDLPYPRRRPRLPDVRRVYDSGLQDTVRRCRRGTAARRSRAPTPLHLRRAQYPSPDPTSLRGHHPLADLDDIVESKAAAGRPQDLAALPHLAALRATLAQQALSRKPTTDVELSGPEEHDGHGLDS